MPLFDPSDTIATPDTMLKPAIPDLSIPGGRSGWRWSDVMGKTSKLIIYLFMNNNFRNSLLWLVPQYCNATYVGKLPKPNRAIWMVFCMMGEMSFATWFKKRLLLIITKKKIVDLRSQRKKKNDFWPTSWTLQIKIDPMNSGGNLAMQIEIRWR